MLKRIKSLIVAISIFMMILPMTPIEAASKSFSEGDCYLYVGEYIYLDYDNNYVAFRSSNKKICVVNEYGKVTAKKSGTAKITANDLKGNKSTCTVHVYKKTDIQKKVKISYINAPFYGEIYTYAVVTNKSNAPVTLDIEITSKDGSGSKKAEDLYISYIAPNGQNLYRLDGYRTGMKEKVKIRFSNSENYDISDMIAVKIEPQDEDVYVTAKNNSNVNATVYVDIIGYDSDDNIVFVADGIIGDEIEKKDSTSKNARYEYEEVYDEYYEDYIYNYLIPVRYETYVNAHAE